MSKGPKTLTSTNQTTVDPKLTQRQDDLWGQASTLANQPYQPYTGTRFEDFNADQKAAWQQARDAAGAGQSDLNQAGAGLGILSSYNAPTVDYAPAAGATAAAGPNVAARSIAGTPGLLDAYKPMTIGASNVTAGKFTDANINQYMNPWIGGVVNTSLGDIERARQEAIAAGEARAAGSKAFGGSRHGVADSLTNREFANTAAATAAGLRKEGFNTAAGLITGDQNRGLQADQGNQAAALQAGIANQSTGLAAGLAGKRNLLDAALADQATGTNVDLANAERAAQTARFNAGQIQSGNQFNAGNALTAAQTNASNANAAAGLRLGAANGLAALGGERQRMLGAGADLLSRIGGQQQAFGQQQKDFDYQQFDEARNRPYQNLDLLSRILGQSRFGQTSTSTTPNPNRGSFLSNALGIGGLLAGGPLGGLIGSKLKGLLGGGGGGGGGVSDFAHGGY